MFTNFSSLSLSLCSCPPPMAVKAILVGQRVWGRGRWAATAQRESEGLGDPEERQERRWKSESGRPIVTVNICPNIHYMFLPLSALPLDHSTWVAFKLNRACRYAWVRDTASQRERESNLSLVKSLLKFLLHYTGAFPQTYAQVSLSHMHAGRVVHLYFYLNKYRMHICLHGWVCIVAFNYRDFRIMLLHIWCSSSWVSSKHKSLKHTWQWCWISISHSRCYVQTPNMSLFKNRNTSWRLLGCLCFLMHVSDSSRVFIFFSVSQSIIPMQFIKGHISSVLQFAKQKKTLCLWDLVQFPAKAFEVTHVKYV